MRKLVMLNRVSLDGFYAGPNGEIDWFIHDPEIDKAAHEGMDADTLLFGRKTYQEFAAFWPHVARDPNASKEFQALAQELNEMQKLVFSKSLNSLSWENSKLYHDDPLRILRELKQEVGAGILIFGSGTLVQQLGNAGLIDEYHLILSPVVLGKGKALFQAGDKFELELLASQKFNSGNVLIRYRARS